MTVLDPCSSRRSGGRGSAGPGSCVGTISQVSDDRRPVGRITRTPARCTMDSTIWFDTPSSGVTRFAQARPRTSNAGPDPYLAEVDTPSDAHG